MLLICQSAASDFSTGDVATKVLGTTTETTTTVTINLAGNGAAQTVHFYTPAGFWNNPAWQDGQITIKVNITAGSTNSTLVPRIRRVDAGGTTQEDDAPPSSQTCGVGVKTYQYTPTWDSGVETATDRMCLQLRFNKASPGAQSITIQIGDADASVDVPVLRYLDATGSRGAGVAAAATSAARAAVAGTARVGAAPVGGLKGLAALTGARAGGSATEALGLAATVFIMRSGASDLNAGGVATNIMDLGEETPSTITIPIGASSNSWVDFYTPVNVPNNPAWADGPLWVLVNVTSGDSDVTLDASIHRVAANGDFIELSEPMTPVTATTGVHAFVSDPMLWAQSPESAGDRMRLHLEFTNAGGATSIDIQVGDRNASVLSLIPVFAPAALVQLTGFGHAGGVFMVTMAARAALTGARPAGAQGTATPATRAALTAAGQGGAAATGAGALLWQLLSSGDSGGSSFGAGGGLARLSGASHAGASEAADLRGAAALVAALAASGQGAAAMAALATLAGALSGGATSAAAGQGLGQCAGSASPGASGAALANLLAQLTGPAHAGGRIRMIPKTLAQLAGAGRAGAAAEGAGTGLSQMIAQLAGAGGAGAAAFGLLAGLARLTADARAGAAATGGLAGRASLAGSMAAGGTAAGGISLIAQMLAAAHAAANGSGSSASQASMTGRGDAGASATGGLAGFAALTGNAFAASHAIVSAVEAAVVGCFERIVKAVRDRYHAQVEIVEDVLTIHDNEPLEDTGEADIWVRFSITAEPTDQLTLDGRHRYLGAATARIFLRAGLGDRDALLLADAINAAFRGVTADEVVYFPPPNPTIRGRSGDRWEVLVTVPFYSACEEEALA